jgi:hypothetical protein
MWKKLRRLWQMSTYTAPMVYIEYTLEDGLVFYRAIEKKCWNGSNTEFVKYGEELTKLANFEKHFADGRDTNITKLSCGALKMLISAIRHQNSGDRYTRPSEAAITANNRVVNKIVDALIYSYEHIPPSKI